MDATSFSEFLRNYGLSTPNATDLDLNPLKPGAYVFKSGVPAPKNFKITQKQLDEFDVSADLNLNVKLYILNVKRYIYDTVWLIWSKAMSFGLSLEEQNLGLERFHYRTAELQRPGVGIARTNGHDSPFSGKITVMLAAIEKKKPTDKACLEISVSVQVELRDRHFEDPFILSGVYCQK